MSAIEANVTIDVPDGQDIEDLVRTIQSLFDSLNDIPTYVNVVEMDNPISTSPINLGNLRKSI